MSTTKAHQRVIRERMSKEESSKNLFGRYWDHLDTSISNAILREITHRTAKNLILQYEWLGTMCNAPIASYGIFFDEHLAGVVVFGSISPPSVASSVAGENWAKKAIQLGRGACTHWAHEHSASCLISYGLKEVRKLGYNIVIAYSDPAGGEIGTVYQATNWLYCGLTEKRPDYFDAHGKRITGPVGKVQSWMTRKPKRRKHRYVYIMGSKKERKQIERDLRWSTAPYPKRTFPIDK